MDEVTLAVSDGAGAPEDTREEDIPIMMPTDEHSSHDERILKQLAVCETTIELRARIENINNSLRPPGGATS